MPRGCAMPPCNGHYSDNECQSVLYLINSRCDEPFVACLALQLLTAPEFGRATVTFHPFQALPVDGP